MIVVVEPYYFDIIILCVQVCVLFFEVGVVTYTWKSRTEIPVTYSIVPTTYTKIL
jgi:hypothetical protein